MKYYIITYGCQMNKSDSERIATLLEKKGYQPVPNPMGADLVVVNMCSVRQKPVEKVRAQILNLKNKNQRAKIILTGCILPEDKKQFSEMADFVLNIKDLLKWPQILHSFMLLCYVAEKHKGKKENRKNQTPSRRSNPKLTYLRVKPRYQTFPRAYVPISFGCNNFCAYCVVPYTRGKEIHRDNAEVIEEIKELVAKKYKQIVLLGENVNTYPNFVELLRKITAIKGDFKVNFIAANPKNFTDELIKEIAENPKLEKYVHLPLQSGDNTILKKMRRPYTREQYFKLVAKIKKKIPDVKIVTDIIVGFPGETKKQFQNTVSVFKKVGFYQAYIAKYSPRAGTAAFKIKDDIPLAEKKRREQVLRKLIVAEVRPPQSLRRSDLRKLIVILGPTAAGKTAFSIKLAKKFKGEIVSADSRQVYQGMDIGTGKITKKERQGIPHYLLDVASPKSRFSVAQYQKLAVEAINKILKKGKTPFLVGGSPFYIYSVVEGWRFPKMKADIKLRKELEKKSPEELFNILKKLDPERAKTIERKNKRRLVRAIEITKTLGKVPKLKKNPQYDCLLIGMKLKKGDLEKRISKRVDEMIKQGLEKEVRGLVKKYGFTTVLRETIGYAEWKKRNSQKIGEEIKTNTWKFTKHQMTWFKRDKRICWITSYREAEKLIEEFLNK